MGDQWLEVLIVLSTYRSWSAFLIGETTSLWQSLVPLLPATYRLSVAHPCLHLWGQKRSCPILSSSFYQEHKETFSDSLCTEIKKGQFSSVPWEVKWSARDIFRQNREEIWDLGNPHNFCFRSFRKILDYKSWWWTDVSLHFWAFKRTLKRLTRVQKIYIYHYTDRL